MLALSSPGLNVVSYTWTLSLSRRTLTVAFPFTAGAMAPFAMSWDTAGCTTAPVKMKAGTSTPTNKRTIRLMTVLPFLLDPFRQPQPRESPSDSFRHRGVAGSDRLHATDPARRTAHAL